MAGPSKDPPKTLQISKLQKTPNQMRYAKSKYHRAANANASMLVCGLRPLIQRLAAQNAPQNARPDALGHGLHLFLAGTAGDPLLVTAR